MIEYNSNDLLAPVSGRCLPVSQAENQELRSKLHGDGIAIIPENGAIFAPCNGKILEIAPTAHYITLETEDGLQLYLQLGIDTADLGGQGFRILVHTGHHIRRGQKIATMNIDMITTEGYDTTIALLITNPQNIKNIKSTRGDVNGGKDIALKYTTT